MATDPLPERFGEYTVEMPLGEGGMASVFVARERITDRQVALKVIRGENAFNKEFIDRFILEVRASVGMRHENIVEVFTCGEQDGRYYMACELVEGGSVRALAERVQKCPAPLAIELVAQLLAGLAYAHDKGVVHRDLKPANLLLTHGGKLKICDFGISKSKDAVGLTKTDSLIGTPAYMSPEQALGDPVDPRSDLFAVGTIFYELLTGKNPFHAESATASLARVLAAQAPPIADVEPAVPELVERVLTRLLEKDPSARYASASEALAELDDAVAEGRSRYPDMIRECLGDPPGLAARLRKDEARACVAESQQLLKAGTAGQNQAALLLYRAVLLDGDDPEAKRLFEQVSSKVQARFSASENPKIAELERKLASGNDPNPAAILQQLAQLYRTEGNLHRAVIYYQRYLRMKPQDGYVASQLSQLVGATTIRTRDATQRTVRGAAPTPGPSTQEIMSGIKAGGFAGSPPSAAPRTASIGGAAAQPSALARQAAELRMKSKPEVDRSGYYKLAAVAFVLIGGVLAIRGIGRFIHKNEEHMNEVAIASAAVRAQEENEALKVQSARELDDRLAEHAKDAAERLQEGDAELARGDARAAVAKYDALILKYPKRAEARTALFKKGKALIELGKDSEALSALDAFITAAPGSPEWPEALLRRGQTQVKRSRMQAAIWDFDKLLGQNAASPFAAEALLGRGEAHAGMGHKEDAMADLKNVLGRTGPSDPLNQRAAAALAALAR